MFISIFQLIMVSSLLMTVSLEMQSAPWQSINDGVMGGVSSGRIAQTESGMRFQGRLSLENNGGFASVRRLIDHDLGSAGSVRLQVRGDGRSYQFRLRMDDRFDGIAWRSEFSTTGDWQTIDLSFTEFKAVFRGRHVQEAGPVVAADIRQIGFMVADGLAGPFMLDIRSIEFVTAGP